MNSTTRRVVGWLVLAVVLLAALVLAVLAVLGTQPNESRGTPRPVPSFPGPGAPDRPPTPSPTPVEPSVEQAQPTTGFLSPATATQMWRASAGSCAAGGATPVLEVTSDGGVTWTDVTPANIAPREVVQLQAIDGTSAEALVLTGDACELEVVRTYTAGQFWEPYPTALTAPAFVDADAGLVATAAGTVPIACPSGTLAPGADPVAMTCPGELATWDGAAWQRQAIDGLVAAAASGTALAIADVAAEGCDGVEIAQRDTAGGLSPLGCAPGSDWAVLGTAGDVVYAWTAAGVTSWPVE